MESRRHFALFSLLLILMSCLFTVCTCRPTAHRDSALASSPDSSDVLMTLVKDVVLSRRRRGSRDDVNVPFYEDAYVQRPFNRQHRAGVFRSRHAPRLAFRSAHAHADAQAQAADRGGWGGAYGK